MPFVNALAAPLVVGGAKIEQALYSGKLRVALSEFTYATDAQATYVIPEFQFQPGQRILAIELNTSVTTGSATIAIGITGTVGKYRAAAAVTTADLWVGSGVATAGGGINAALGVRLAAAEQLIMTTAGATLPASGRLLMRAIYVDNT